jgi:transcriptional regulator with XRE-family HTH domain
MRDNKRTCSQPIGQQIRRLREEQGWSLAALARKAGTSAPTLHRYENGWDRFGIDTLRKLAAALGARLEVNLVTVCRRTGAARRSSATALVRKLSPLFWDRDLVESDLVDHEGWVLERVLTSGDRNQVQLSRAFFGDDAIRRAIERRGMDRRTRHYWDLILGDTGHAS